MGRMQARICRALLPRGGSVVYIEGPPLAPAVVNRRDGLMEGLRGSRVEVVKTLAGDWNEESGERVTTLWLRVGRAARPGLIASQNDIMAVGARKAIQAWKPEWLDVPIAGCDGLPEGGQRMVREKLLAATVIQPLAAVPAVELVARFLGGEQVPPSTILSPSTFPPIEELERK
jgi:ribose transport system substrate-binding protein